MQHTVRRGIAGLQFAFLILFCTVLNTLPLIAARQACEAIWANTAQPLLIHPYSPHEVQIEIEKIMKDQKLPQKKAKGAVGEQLSRQTIEKGVIADPGFRVISLFKHFNQLGCPVVDYLRNRADNGIDDIFVVVNDNGQIDQRFPPIFHEAKYNNHCRLKLNETIKHCQQLSFEWLHHHLIDAQTRASHRLHHCQKQTQFISKLSCSACPIHFLTEMIWLEEMLKAGKYWRTASVLCPSGLLIVFRVEGVKQFRSRE